VAAPGSRGQEIFAGLRVLVVDDESSVRELFTIRLQRWGCRVEIACSALEGVERYLQSWPDLVLMDLEMPGGNGFDASRMILERDPEARIILITEFPETFIARKSLEEKLVKLVVQKPFYFDQLKMAIQEVTKKPKPSQPLRKDEEVIA
jgi:CheY-like chemotaxis protein